MNRALLKSNAKDSLKNHFGEAIAIFLISSAITGVASFIIGFIFGMISAVLKLDTNSVGLLSDSVNGVVSIIINGFIALGLTSFYLKLSRNQEVEINELFSKTNMFGLYIVTTILIGLFTTLGFLLIIPGFIFSIALSQTYYILLDNPEIDPMKAIKQSWEMMKGHKLEYLLLQMSFLGWIILGIFTCGILYLWLTPYMAVTNANFYNYIKNDYEQKNLG